MKRFCTVQTVQFLGICTVCTVLRRPAMLWRSSNEKAAANFAAALSSCWIDYGTSGDCCNSSILREAAGHLFGLGLSLQTVIPLALPAGAYPQSWLKSKTGQQPAWSPVALACPCVSE